MNKVLIFILSASFALTTTSCLKKQDLSSEDLGPAIQPMQLTKAMGEGYGSYDFNEIKKDEFSSLMYSWRLQDSMTQNVWQQGMTVKESINTVDSLKLDVIVQKDTYSNGQTSQSTRDWPLEFTKNAGVNSTSTKKLVTMATDPDAPKLMFLFFQGYAFGSCYDSGTDPQTCHNLSVTDVQYRVPPAAAVQQKCDDVTNCFVPAKKIEYDMLEKAYLDKNGNPNRSHVTMVLSPHVPFLSRFLKLCVRSLFDFTGSNQQTLADVCYTVNNFASGQ